MHDDVSDKGRKMKEFIDDAGNETVFMVRVKVQNDWQMYNQLSKKEPKKTGNNK